MSEKILSYDEQVARATMAADRLEAENLNLKGSIIESIDEVYGLQKQEKHIGRRLAGVALAGIGGAAGMAATTEAAYAATHNERPAAISKDRSDRSQKPKDEIQKSIDRAIAVADQKKAAAEAPSTQESSPQGQPAIASKEVTPTTNPDIQEIYSRAQKEAQERQRLAEAQREGQAILKRLHTEGEEFDGFHGVVTIVDGDKAPILQGTGKHAPKSQIETGSIQNPLLIQGKDSKLFFVGENIGDKPGDHGPMVFIEVPSKKEMTSDPTGEKTGIMLLNADTVGMRSVHTFEKRTFTVESVQHVLADGLEWSDISVSGQRGSPLDRELPALTKVNTLREMHKPHTTEVTPNPNSGTIPAPESQQPTSIPTGPEHIAQIPGSR